MDIAAAVTVINSVVHYCCFCHSAGADAMKKFTPSLGIPYLGV